MYTPKLDPDLVKRLYALCQKLEMPMTRFVNEAVAQVVRQAEECLERKGKERVGVEQPKASSGSWMRDNGVGRSWQG